MRRIAPICFYRSSIRRICSFERDSVEDVKGFAPNVELCSRMCTVSQMGDERSQYSLEHGSFLSKICSIGGALENDIRRMQYELFEKPQLSGQPSGRGIVRSLLPRLTLRTERETESAVISPEHADEQIRLYLQLHELNYYFRMVVAPKRHLGYGIYNVIWNCILGLWNSCFSMMAVSLHHRYSIAAPTPLIPSLRRGFRAAVLYIGMGFVVSPALHIVQAIVNAFTGAQNIVLGRWTFDAAGGIYIRHSSSQNGLRAEQFRNEMRCIFAVGRREFRARRMNSETKWKDHLSRLGFTSRSTDDPYAALGVRPDATQQEIKQSYQKYAKLYHPDMNGSSESRQKFEEVTAAYKLISNAENRRIFDRGGKRAVDNKTNALAAGSSGDILERVFGGIWVRDLLVGTYYRSHWHLKFMFQCSVSLHDLEVLQSLRVRLLSAQLEHIVSVALDGSAILCEPGRVDSPDEKEFTSAFRNRLERYISQLTKSTFSRELLYEVGNGYILTAQIFLGIKPFYAYKLLTTRKLCSGFERLREGFTKNVRGSTKEELQRMAAVEFFCMEWDNIVIDTHITIRFVTQIVAQSEVDDKAAHIKRLRAIWYIGDRMRRAGVPWSGDKFDDKSLIQYLQRVTKVDTSAPPVF